MPMFDAKPYQPPAIEIEEMSFAIALFVAAAGGRVAPPTMGTSDDLQESQLFSAESATSGANAMFEGEPTRLPDEVPLACAVSVLWHHYDQDDRQQAMCSRLVAFYAWMSRRRGQLFHLTATESKSYLLAAALSPAVVKAVATATVGEGGLFDDAEFESLVESFATGDETRMGPSAIRGPARPYRSSPAHLAVTEGVEQLSFQLLAFESCVATDPTQPAPYFRALEQLCVRVADISGSATLHAMLSRAWRAALPEFGWLQCAPPSNARLLIGLDGVQPPPTPQEAMKCEMAILGLLIELLRSLLGDSVTVQLLRSLWPLADLNPAPQAADRSLGIWLRENPQPSAGRIQ